MPPRKKTTKPDALGRERSTTRAAWGKVRAMRSGRLQASYVGPDGNRHTAPETFTTRGDAAAWLATQRARIVEGTWTPRAAVEKHEAQAARAQRLGDYARHWIATRTNRKGEPLRERTRSEYHRMIAGPLAPLADLPLTAINRATVREWYATQTATGKLTQAARVYGFLSSLLATAAGDKLIVENPCTIKGASSASTGKKVVPPTPAELAIISATMPEWLRAAVTLAAWTSIRYGELTELRVKDVELVGGDVWVSITRAVTHVTGKGFVVGPPKSSAGVRVVVLPAALAGPVLDHLTAYDLWGSPEALLFPASSGGHLAQSVHADYWYPSREAAGRPDLPWHGLRHYGLTRFAATGATLREIMLRAGHSSTTAAIRYQHGMGRDAELAARMAELA